MHSTFSCEHEKEFGQIGEAFKRYDEHIKVSWKKIDQLTDAVNSLREMAQKQSAQLNEMCTLRGELLNVTQMVAGIASDNKNSVARAHERIDDVEKKVNGHTADHCDICRNQSSVDDTKQEFDEFRDKMEVLIPVAKAVEKVRDNVLVWLFYALLAVAAVTVIYVAAKQTGVTPSIQINK